MENSAGKQNIKNVLIMMACLVIILAGIKSAVEIVVPFLLALFLAIICTPLINFLVRLKVPLWLAVIALLGLIVITLTSFAGLVGNAINEFSASIPLYKQLLAQRIAGLAAIMDRFDLYRFIPKNLVEENLDPNIIMGLIRRLLAGISGVITNGFVLLLIVVFMLFEAQSMKQKLTVLFANKQEQKELENIQRVLSSVISYLAIKTFVSLVTGILVWAALVILDVQYAVLWGTVAFLLNYIPNIGSVLAAIPVIIQAMILNGYSDSLFVAIAFLVINMVMGNIIEPRMMGRTLGLSTLVVFISLIFWGWLLGSVGMLLSVPLTMAVKIALESSEKTKKYAYLLGE
ncbi:membrane protein [Gallibacterium salpingitidis]|uniref:Membrane protein n=1 Tax=Gallibacterium salpingitidis TaxID=505341 RepID=A0AB36E486_9PAST|nr:AI-2E family transporter [Gallibacterium salpingitidis]OBX07917.1 membrane protein [Gallibacterium salpingitidis]OBX11490.1 membrane protein [Gallibacterium salpingitidis]WKT00717.1 AI-2E family transporter [Gallibacterium salpingitidis]